MTLPGTRALRLARRLFGRTTTARVLEPLVADWQHEWQRAATGAERLRAWASGALAATATFSQMAVRSTAMSPSVRPVLRQVALWSAVFSIDPIADARNLPCATAAMTVLVSATSWLPILTMGSMWQSRRYARLWQAGLAVTLASAAAALVLTGWIQPIAAAAIDTRFTTIGAEHLMTLPDLLSAGAGDIVPQSALRREQLLRLGPAVFALLSGIASVAHLRSGRRMRRVFSAGYVFAGTVVCATFVLFVSAARGFGVDRSIAMMLGMAAVMAPATGLFVLLAESERRVFVRYRGRREDARRANAAA